MKLTSKVLKSGASIFYGHAILDSMQNWRMPKIDLFVREVIQNCSDAADDVEGNECFFVDFNAKEFNGRDFICLLEGFDEKTIKRFSGEHCKYLEIRDTGTTGLTGPLTITRETEKDHGNYVRLVFDVGKGQTRKYSGGNWGYGKSAYYEMGAGFVIYYSRIMEDGMYKSRLIVTFIEDEENEEAVLRGHRDGSISAGRAWWGKEIQKDQNDEIILPLQEEIEIEEVLSVFGISPFSEKETGTSVIIPYVDYGELMGNMISEEMNVLSDIRTRCPWTIPDNDGFIRHLKLSIQRWYAPAIQNTDLPRLSGKKWLYVTVNDEPITFSSMYPFFQLVQKLYNASLAKTVKQEESESEWTPFVSSTTYPIRVNNYIDNSNGGNTEVGYLSVAKISKKFVDCGEANNLDPFLLLGYYEESGKNRPLVMFARRLGMVIDYAYRNEWTDGIPIPEEDDEYVFSFFVPYLGDSKKLKPNLSVKMYAGKTLEEYLISCEASDHDGWEDHDRMTLVTSIQSRVSDRIKLLLKGDVIPHSGASSDRLGYAVARMLGITKPKLGKGGKSSSNSSTTSTIRGIKFVSEIQEYHGENQIVHFVLEVQKGVKSVAVDLVVHSDGKNLRSVEWEINIGTIFPVEFAQCVLKRINGKEIEYQAGSGNSTNGASIQIVTLRHETRKMKNGDVKSSHEFTRLVFAMEGNTENVLTYEGLLFIHARERDFEYDLVVSEGER